MLKRKVLIIDDEVDMCQLLKTYLTDLDYDVSLAHTLNEGITLLHEIKPDVIFIDNNLPDGLGWESVRFLCEQLPNSRINLMSAYQTVPDQLLPLHNSNVRIIEKPLRLLQLREFL